MADAVGGLKLKITFITLVMDVKTLGAGDRPKGRTRNWKSLPFQLNLIYLHVDGCNRT
jgi:hypothetical protein